MGKVKEWYRSVPIWLTVFLYAAAALVGASFLSNRVTGTAYIKMTGLTVNYILRTPVVESKVAVSDETVSSDHIHIEQGDFTSASGQIFSSSGEGNVTTWVASINQMSEEDAHRYAILQKLTRYAPFAIYSGLFLAAALTFYFTKLKRPLALLETASAKIRTMSWTSPCSTPAGTRWRSSAPPLKRCAPPWMRTTGRCSTCWTSGGS